VTSSYTITGMSENENASDTIYKWTVRSLYTAAIAINLWYLIEQYRKTPEGEAILNKSEKWRDKVRKSILERKRFRRMVDEVVVEAWVHADSENKESETE